MTIHTNFDALPVNLPAGPRYVVWRFEVRDGRRTKVPYVAAAPTTRASVTNPATWAQLATAVAAVNAQHAHGVGLVLVGGLVAIDLDHCVDPDSGQCTPFAAGVLAAVPTYTERSPSGRGLHALLFGSLPPGGRRHRELEIYDRGRFVTLSGDHVATTPRQIVDHGGTLPALHAQWFPAPRSPVVDPAPAAVPLRDEDAALVAKAHAARNGARFAALWAGENRGYASASEADLALCRLLAFWTQADAMRIDRLFRQSGRWRSKWDAARGTAATYGSRTVALAIAHTRIVYEPGPALVEALELP